MKIVKLAPLFILPLIVTSCSKKNVNPQPEDKQTVTINMPATLSSEKKDTGYDLTFEYKDEYFTRDSKVYDRDLSLLSFGACMIDSSEDGQFFATMGYDNVTFSEGYDDKPTEDGIGYVFAHKFLEDGSSLVAVSFRGLNYGAEWSNNLQIGEEGDHEGWSLRADEVLASLKTYLTNYIGHKFKLWITGYSRAGAMSNVLASKIFREANPIINKENMYVYTFECPQGLSEEHAIEYENVHNVLNTADPITYIAPSEWGLSRCGKDVNIYNEDIDRIVYNFDTGIILPALAKKTNYYETDQELVSYILSSLMKEQSGDYQEYSMHTREDYCSNYQQVLSYLMGIVWQLSSESMNGLMTDIEALGDNIYTLLMDDTVYNMLVPYVDADEIVCDKEELRASCNKVVHAIPVIGLDLVIMMLDPSTKTNLSRFIYMHFPEVNYALLLQRP